MKPHVSSPSEQRERCAICLDDLDMDHEVLETDDEVQRTRLDSVARQLRKKAPEVASRRVQLDCGGAHEFCYVCAIQHYLQTGNKCPLCQRRFTRIADRAVADRDGSQPMPRRPRSRSPSVSFP